ncbi:hypothetical protein GCM10023085_76780 [Actinomadura viridis]
MPGNHNDCTPFRDSGADNACRGASVMADGGYQGNRQVIMPYRRPRDGGGLLAWQIELNTVHRRVRARVEHAFAHMKWWNILRNRRRKRDGVHYATCGIASCATWPWSADPRRRKEVATPTPNQQRPDHYGTTS